MARIVNLYGGPGTGKSTSAAFLFSRLKDLGCNAELVREAAKSWAWEGRRIGPYDQYLLLGEQIHNESMLHHKVDYIINDCPVLMTAVYAGYCPESLQKSLVESCLAIREQTRKDGNMIIDILLKRSKPFQPAGRYQDEEQARSLDGKICDILAVACERLIQCETDHDSLNELLVTEILP